jgi:hypothetical protein
MEVAESAQTAHQATGVRGYQLRPKYLQPAPPASREDEAVRSVKSSWAFRYATQTAGPDRGRVEEILSYLVSLTGA